MADASQLAQLKMDSKTTLKASDIKVHDFTITGKSAAAADEDILDQVTKAARQATQTQPATSMKMSAVDIEFDGLRADLGDEGPEAKPLREAKQLINDRQFESALVKLQEVFAIEPRHHEATYLKAYCQFQMNRLKASLETLLELRGAEMSNRLQTRVRGLKEEIRAQTLPKATAVYAKAVKSGDVSKALGQLRQFAETDPGLGKFHYFLAGALVVGKQMKEARAAAAAGLQVCETDRDELQQLCQQIDKRYLPEMLGPARNHFRARQYPQASQALAALPADVQTMALWKTFNGFLDQLTGQGDQGGKKGGLFSRSKPGGISTRGGPPGSHTEVKELYEYLVEPEMKTARAAVENKDFNGAERALTSALGATPAFSVANHMLATCVYQRVGASVKEKIGKDLDDAGVQQLRRCKEQLDDARKYALIGSQDFDIQDGQRLLESIDEMRNEIEGVVETHEANVHDSKLVNSMIDKLIPILVSIITINQKLTTLSRFSSQYEIINLRSELQSLYGTLRGMRDELTNLRRKCKGERAREVMDLVRENFVDPNYNALRQILG